jgi:hypothetical protein
MSLHANRCQGASPVFLSDRNLAKSSEGLARHRSPTDGSQDKSREVRPVGLGRMCLSAQWFLQPATAPREVPKGCLDLKGIQNQSSA